VADLFGVVAVRGHRRVQEADLLLIGGLRAGPQAICQVPS
jgi:hypothetical protein